MEEISLSGEKLNYFEIKISLQNENKFCVVFYFDVIHCKSF